MNIGNIALALVGVFLAVANIPAAEVSTVPEGYVKVTIAAGNGSNKVLSRISFPMMDLAIATGQMQGRITGVFSNKLANSSAAWTPGQLSVSATPYVVRITSGAAKGHTFLISTLTANTSTEITIDPADASLVDLTTLGIVASGTAGDTYEIAPCDTFASLLGTPATTGVLGGANANVADSIVMLAPTGAPTTYFYSTTLGRWTKSTLGNPDASNAPIRPESGLVYSRLGSTPLNLFVTGRAPTVDRKVVVRSSGTTILSQGWPVDITLQSSGLQNMPNWTPGANANTADTVQIGVSTYWFDGTNWRKQALGSPVSNSVVIPAGTSLTLNQLGSQTGSSILRQTLMYSLGN